VKAGSFASVAAVCCVLLTGPLQAAEPGHPAGAVVKDGPIGRWQIIKTDQGFVKLDTATGRMSQCREAASGLVCSLVPDDREALEAELDRLSARVAALESKPAPAQPRAPLLSREEQEKLDRFMGFAGEAMRRFKGLAEDLRDEWNRPTPDRT
jgi:hypothetical protein